MCSKFKATNTRAHYDNMFRIVISFDCSCQQCQSVLYIKYSLKTHPIKCLPNTRKKDQDTYIPIQFNLSTSIERIMMMDENNRKITAIGESSFWQLIFRITWQKGNWCLTFDISQSCDAGLQLTLIL